MRGGTSAALLFAIYGLSCDYSHKPSQTSLTGTGTAARLVPTSLDFGNRKVGTISPVPYIGSFSRFFDWY